MSVAAWARHRAATALRRALSCPSGCRAIQTTSCAMSTFEEKKALRKESRERLKKADADLLKQQSNSIADRVLQSSFFQSSKSTGLYLTCTKLREVDTSRLLERILQDSSSGRRCYAPAVEDKESNMTFLHVDGLEGVQEMPPYGIQEPTQTYSDGRPRDNVLQMDIPLDLLIMTGQAFDREGGRLGRGGGYYDKFIARCMLRAKNHGWEPPLLVALAFEEQVASGRVPKSENDVDMDVLVLAKEMLGCSERGKLALSQSA